MDDGITRWEWLDGYGKGVRLTVDTNGLRMMMFVSVKDVRRRQSKPFAGRNMPRGNSFVGTFPRNKTNCAAFVSLLLAFRGEPVNAC